MNRTNIKFISLGVIVLLSSAHASYIINSKDRPINALEVTLKKSDLLHPETMDQQAIELPSNISVTNLPGASLIVGKYHRSLIFNADEQQLADLQMKGNYAVSIDSNGKSLFVCCRDYEDWIEETGDFEDKNGVKLNEYNFSAKLNKCPDIKGFIAIMNNDSGNGNSERMTAEYFIEQELLYSYSKKIFLSKMEQPVQNNFVHGNNCDVQLDGKATNKTSVCFEVPNKVVIGDVIPKNAEKLDLTMQADFKIGGKCLSKLKILGHYNFYQAADGTLQSFIECDPDSMMFDSGSFQVTGNNECFQGKGIVSWKIIVKKPVMHILSRNYITINNKKNLQVSYIVLCTCDFEIGLGSSLEVKNLPVALGDKEVKFLNKSPGRKTIIGRTSDFSLSGSLSRPEQIIIPCN